MLSKQTKRLIFTLSKDIFGVELKENGKAIVSTNNDGKDFSISVLQKIDESIIEIHEKGDFLMLRAKIPRTDEGIEFLFHAYKDR